MSNRAMCVAFLLSLVPSGVSGQVPLGAEFRVNSYTTNRQSEPSVSCGGYGECVDCGNAIPYPRLAAYPAAKRCVACQEKAERLEKVRK